ncbi:hypothetical protein Goshw_014243 [Gossypium schwendimanii]|uniref:Uncharacterized protein n=1 Tax=Gossypium schwendimanii TaxID=34291 RepID=A0A7J9L3A0_GOSSC|nr:hypothetical protein [Gossypium schwendimanii]
MALPGVGPLVEGMDFGGHGGGGEPLCFAQHMKEEVVVVVHVTLSPWLHGPTSLPHISAFARRLVAVDSKHHKIDNILHFSIKNDMKNDRKNNSVAVLQAKSSSSKELRSMKEESIEESHGYNVTQKLEDAEVKYHKTIVEIEKKKNPSVAVSWRVPHKKHGEKNPGFNLDYSPPKTHPPHHN